MSFTYAQLKQAIQDFTEYTETSFVNNIPLFIRQAEERLLKNVQISLFRKNATASTTASNKYLASPSDFLAPFSLSYEKSNGEKEFLEFKDPSFIQTFTPAAATTGEPRYYAIFDVNNFILAPTPDQAYAVELHYLYRPASLTAQTEDGTTWLSENAPLALLYGTLVEAYTYMKGDPDLLQLYERRFQEGVVGVKMLGEAKQTTDQYRSGQVRRAKQ